LRKIDVVQVSYYVGVTLEAVQTRTKFGRQPVCLCTDLEQSRKENLPTCRYDLPIPIKRSFYHFFLKISLKDSKNDLVQSYFEWGYKGIVVSA